MKHNSRSANLRVLLEDESIRESAQELAEAVQEAAAEDRRGTRLRESNFLGIGSSPKGDTKPHNLSDGCFQALIKFLNDDCGQERFIDMRELRRIPGTQQLLNRALRCSRLFQGGVSFRSASDSPRDSNIVYKEAVSSSTLRAGQIKQIFSYAIRDARGQRSESTYLLVEPLEELSHTDARKDPYRQYGFVGGRLCYARYLPHIVIRADLLISHFARTPVEFKAISQPCIHVLPLDKVCNYSSYSLRVLITTVRVCALCLMSPTRRTWTSAISETWMSGTT